MVRGHDMGILSLLVGGWCQPALRAHATFWYHGWKGLALAAQRTRCMHSFFYYLRLLPYFLCLPSRSMALATDDKRHGVARLSTARACCRYARLYTRAGAKQARPAACLSPAPAVPIALPMALIPLLLFLRPSASCNISSAARHAAAFALLFGGIRWHSSARAGGRRRKAWRRVAASRRQRGGWLSQPYGMTLCCAMRAARGAAGRRAAWRQAAMASHHVHHTHYYLPFAAAYRKVFYNIAFIVTCGAWAGDSGKRTLLNSMAGSASLWRAAGAAILPAKGAAGVALAPSLPLCFLRHTADTVPRDRRSGVALLLKTAPRCAAHLALSAAA